MNILAPVDGVAQVPNPYYLGGPQPVVDPQANFIGAGFVPVEVPVPNGMVPQPVYGSYYPDQVPQQQQQPPQQHQLAGPEPVQYSQQDYAREANVAPVEYLPGVGLSAAVQQEAVNMQQQPTGGEVASSVAPAEPLFGEQVQHGMDLPQTVAAEAPEVAALAGNHEPNVGAEPTSIPSESNQLSTPPTADSAKESTEPSESTSSASDVLDSTIPAAAAAAVDSTDSTPAVSSDAPAQPEDPPIVDLDGDNSKDDCVITSPTPRSEGLCSSTKKKRRRIVQEDDSESDENDRERMELLRSPEPPVAADEGAVNSSLDQLEDKEKAVEDGEGQLKEGDEDEGRSDSRNSSGDRNDAAPSIFQNVVMIPAADADAHKRKKIRVLDSDDDDDDQHQAMATTVDDIGLTGEGADELNPGDGIDEGGDDGEFGEGLEQIVAMDAPIIDQSRMLEEGEDDDEEDQNGSDKEKDKEGSDREERDEVNGSDVEEPATAEVEEEVEEEEEEAEEGVEMITAEDDAGEAIGIATDDEKELDEPEAQESAPEDGGSEQEEAASEAEAGSDAERSESRSAAGSSEENQDSQDSTSNQRKSDDEDSDKDQDQETTKKTGDSGDEVVCQNDVELNTISLLTDEEDDNPTPLPTPKKELPVVRIVNIKKELLDVSRVKKERYDPTSYYQQQHQIKQRQLEARKKEKKKKRERNFDNNDPFGAWSSSSTDDEFIPNDIYFGTPDRVFTANTKIKCQRQKQMNERYSAKYGKSGKRRYSDDSDGEERRKRKQKLEQLSRLNLPSYQQAQLQTMIKKKKKKHKDRFYDKSQDIPNDIYFGNVNVPLHILYAFGDSSSEDERPNTSWRSEPSSHSSHKYHRSGGGPGSRGPYKKSSSSYAAFERSSVSPSSDRSVQAMKEYLKIAGFKHVKFHKLWEGCKSNQERANAILRLMQDKGLEGEPTVAKCRELRKQLQMEREAQVLDTSLIIDSGEGRITRRSKRNHGSSDPSDPNAPSTSGTAVLPESAEAINRIRSLVDPDSDGE